MTTRAPASLEEASAGRITELRIDCANLAQIEAALIQVLGPDMAEAVMTALSQILQDNPSGFTVTVRGEVQQ